MAVKWWADEDVEAARPWAWPFILDAMKAGDGVASARSVSDARLIKAAGLAGAVDDCGNSIIRAFVEVGLVVEAEGGFVARSWAEYQREDVAKRERQRRWREKKTSERRLGDVSETSRDVAETHERRRDDVAETATVQYSTVHNSTIQADVVDDTSRARPVEPPRLTTTPTIPDRLHDVCEAFRRTQSGRMAMMLPPATVGLLSDMTAEHGAAVVLEAIRRACERCRGDLTIAYLRPVVAAVVAGEPEQRPKEDQSGRRGAAYRAENGCASPEICEDPLG